ncbi:MAG: membrane integrity-associated transporter subunit PqiC [Syntrophaceae bacterium]|nr:membrane integrity-associated transporter subunit PqiC [Syntrophaceae bacterium]
MNKLMIISKNKILFPVVIFLLFFFVACSSTGKPGYEIKYYLLDYPAPVFKKLPQLNSTVRFNRFTIAAAYNTQNMIFRADNYSVDYFSYNRWAVNPADMVADILLRDMQASKYFHAVFSRYSSVGTNYLIEASVGEFFLRMQSNQKVAVLCLEVTLKDAKRREVDKRVVYQKKYRHEELLSEQSPRGYSQAMSHALSKVSEQIIVDVYMAIKSAR